MKQRIITALLTAIFAIASSVPAFAHGGSKNVKLHVSNRWSECALQLDPSLTQQAWSRFTEEAGLITYFRSLTDAQPMSVGNFEVSLLQWQSKIDDTNSSWNDTFVHPDSTHWLYEGDRFGFPGLTARTGITDRIDIGVYFTQNPNANYGFWGGQVQYNIVNDQDNRWAASARASMVNLFGPDDIDFGMYGVDFLASRSYPIFSDWVSVSPYAGISAYLSRSHENSAVVTLNDENIFGTQAMIGAVAEISSFRCAVEYNYAAVQSLSFKLGAAF